MDSRAARRSVRSRRPLSSLSNFLTSFRSPPIGPPGPPNPGGGPIRRFMAEARPPTSSEPFLSPSASRMNFSAAFVASSGVRRLSLLVSASSMTCGARNIPGPKPGGGPPPGPSPASKPGGGPIRRLIASRSAATSSEPFLSLSASRTNRSAALAASSVERRPSLSASAASRSCGARNIPGPKPPGGPPPGPPGPKPPGIGPPWPLVAGSWVLVCPCVAIAPRTATEVIATPTVMRNAAPVILGMMAPSSVVQEGCGSGSSRETILK